MEWIEELEAFWTSETGINFYRNLTIVGVWTSIPICLALAFLIHRTGKKYQARKKELKNLLNSPDMEDIRWFLKRPLSKHGIDIPTPARKDNKRKNGNGN